MANANSNRTERNESKNRQRVWIVESSQNVSNTSGTNVLDTAKGSTRAEQQELQAQLGIICGWPTEPAVGRVADGVAHRVDRLKALGNGQVSRVAARAWRILNDEP